MSAIGCVVRIGNAGDGQGSRSRTRDVRRIVRKRGAVLLPLEGIP